MRDEATAEAERLKLDDRGKRERVQLAETAAFVEEFRRGVLLAWG
jgi:hypothetical protein